MSLKNIVIDFLGDVVRNGGKIATKEHYLARMAICEGCEYKGMVRPLPAISAVGCTKCKCPLVTKLKCIENLDIETGKMVTTRCGNVEKGGEDFWADVETKFKNNYA